MNPSSTWDVHCARGEDHTLTLISYQTIIHLIASTKTTTGLRIKAKLTQRTYPAGVEIPAAEVAKLNLKPDAFHGNWNYSVLPQ
jgi:hypothetical protein